MTTQQTKVERARRIIAETYGHTRDERGTLMVGDGPARVEAIVRGDGDQYWEMRAVMAAICVAQPEAPTPSPELTARMVVFVDRVSTGQHFTSTDEAHAVTAEAKAIKAELVPVDGDLIEAREVCACRSEADGLPAMAEAYRNGRHDSYAFMAVALAAIKRGRALPRAEK